MIDAYTESILIFTGINIILALSLYIPISAGQDSLGQGGFMSIGAYTSAYLTTVKQISFYPSLLAGSIVAGFVGFLIGFPTLRLKGLYIALMTLGFGEVVRVFFLNFSPTGGPAGISGIQPNTTLIPLYSTILILLIFINRIDTSSMGRAFRAIREDESAAECIGINLTSVKLVSFTLGAIIAGLGGGFYAHYVQYIDSAQFGFHKSIEIFIFVILGGIETFWGALVGSTILTVLPELLRFMQTWRIEFYGIIMLLMMIFRPKGLLSRKTVKDLLIKLKFV